MTEKVAYFTTAHAHIACRHVDVVTDIAVQFVHKRLAKTHDFAVAFACGIEVRAAFCSAHGQRSERVFERLLEAQKFHCVEIDVFLKTKTALERTDCVVELHAVAPVDVVHSVVVHPRNAENDLPLGFDHAFENDVLSKLFFVLRNGGSER